MFQALPLPIVRSFSLYTQQWYMSHSYADSLRVGSGRNCRSVLILLASCQQNLCDTYHYCVYSEKLLMMGRTTALNI